MKSKNQKQMAIALFLLSGLVSLVFQVVWLKMLVLVFGNTVWAVTTLLTAFMSGLALGSWIFGKIADRSASPLRLYGILESIIGIIGLLTPIIFSNLDLIYRPLYRLFGGDNLLLGVVKFIIAFIVLLIPTSMMGGTLPLLAKKFTEDIKTAGSNIGTLYTINTFGAVIGTLFAGFVLIPFLGVKLTILVASLINFTILTGVLLVTRGESCKFETAELIKTPKKTKSKNSYILWIYFACGFAALSYEVLWNRILVLHIGSNVYAYSVMLAVYLLGITLGAGLMSYFIKRIKNAVAFLSIIQVVLFLDVIFQIKQFSNLSNTIRSMGTLIGSGGYFQYTASLIFSTLQILLIPTLLFGASFPLAVKIFISDKKNLGKDTGLLYAFNTIGTIFGSFCAGFIFIPIFGAQLSLIITGAINFMIAVCLIIKSGKAIKTLAYASAAALALFIALNIFLVKKDEALLNAQIFSEDENRQRVEILNFSEDIYATVTVEEREDVSGVWKSLSMNGVNVAGTSCELFTIQKLQGHLPLLLHKNPKSVLHIGFGSGGTAWAVSRYPVEKITIAEISRSIIKKSSEYFQDVNHGVLNDPRLDIHFTDGRNFVLATDEKFDVILSDSIHPRFSGNGSLYTYDYYKLLRDRLKPGGVVSQWLPFYSLTNRNFKMIIRAFYDVFPNTTIWYTNSTLNSYVIVTGSMDNDKIDFNNMAEKLKIESIRADLAEIDTETPYKILDYYMFSNEKVGEFLKGIPPHTDDNMAVEYESGRQIKRLVTTIENFHSILQFRTDIVPYLENIEAEGRSGWEVIDTIRKYQRATELNLKAQILFYLGNRDQAFGEFEKIPFLNPNDLEPVEYFGAKYQKPFLTKARLPE